jgi:hypothetical protein
MNTPPGVRGTGGASAVVGVHVVTARGPGISGWADAGAEARRAAPNRAHLSRAVFMTTQRWQKERPAASLQRLALWYGKPP